jgi:hypothetical protein
MLVVKNSMLSPMSHQYTVFNIQHTVSVVFISSQLVEYYLENFLPLDGALFCLTNVGPALCVLQH